jgi:hypothetical protein
LKYAALSVQRKVNPRGDVPSASWNRKPKLSGGADEGFNSYYAACACSKSLGGKKGGGKGAETLPK